MTLLKIASNGQWELLNKANALGITAEKGKPKFDPSFGQKEYREYVDERADHIPSTGYGVGKVDDFNWHFDPEFELSKITPIKKDWKAWYDNEMAEWEYDHGEERKGHFDRWAAHPESKPIIIIQGTDDKPHIWDGHHRVAMAHIKHMKKVPVICGTRKK